MKNLKLNKLFKFPGNPHPHVFLKEGEKITCGVLDFDEGEFIGYL